MNDHPRSARALLVVVLLLVAVLGLEAGPARASENPQASIQPTAADGAVRPYVIVDLDAGRTAQDSLTLVNKTTAPITFDLYTADAYNDAQGAFVLRRAEDPKRDMGAWIRLPLDELTIEPSGRVQVPFEIAVPREATPGDHTGGVVALARPAAGPDDGSGDVRLRIRNGVGVRVYGRVRGPAAPAVRVTEVHLDVDDDLGSALGLRTSGTLRYTVRNAGNVRLLPAVRAHVSGTFGLSDQRSGQQLQELLPGQSQTVVEHLDDVRAIGRLRATVSATAQGATDTASTSVLRIPWLLLLLVAVAAGAGALERRRRRRRRLAAPAASGTPAPTGTSLGGWPA